MRDWDRDGVAQLLTRALRRIDPEAPDLRRLPPDRSLASLDVAPVDLDSLLLLEVVGEVEEELGFPLEVAAGAEWTAYTWGDLLDDLAAAIVAAQAGQRAGGGET